MPPVYCLNGHDAAGVEGFTCPICRAELRTVLSGQRIWHLRPDRLMAVSVLPSAVFVALVTARAETAEPTTAAVLIALSLVGAALWVAACVLVATVVDQPGSGPGPFAG